MSSEYLSQFSTSCVEVMGKMMGLACEWQEVVPRLPTITEGMTVVTLIGLTGSTRGRIMMEMELRVAQELAEMMNGESLKAMDPMVFYSLTELSNIFSGKAVTQLNNRPEKPGLRLTPPNIFVGEKIQIFTEKAALSTAQIRWNNSFLYIHLCIERG
jgi:CheY-specific phosphatase CheX